ncbi:MAG TPA: glycoside hydrolase family 2 TIM barrel-domain containing protein [Gemmatimonadaceae bacterium]|nr:glycoside hydrolase family 2 TIM barrel-domain containing protein [Gemmatimonadaceae bacterium]
MNRLPASRMRAAYRFATLALAPALLSAPLGAQERAPMPAADSVPLPEQPRPDFARADWRNLNGRWQFAFDPQNSGESARWFDAPLASPRSISVPYSWGSQLSGVPDSADIGWYSRTITIPAEWQGKRVFLVVGASDWRTSAWLDGTKLGDHQGGYTPFAFELTPDAKPGAAQRLTLRVDDTAHPFQLEGKQGYGKARGIWQTIYLEARGSAPLETVHFTPDITKSRVTVEAMLREPAPRDLALRFSYRGAESARPVVTRVIRAGEKSARFDVPVPGARLWSLEDPYLYEVTVTVGAPGLAEDRVDSYFGMRSISVVARPGSTDSYVALNGKPVYLQLALDQAYHPEGFYTFPSDSFTRNEILRARQIGLNGLREHVKIETPRKLYWADRLGVLIMADVPNSWGPPDSAMFAEHDYAMRGMITRDYNHPSIFAWVPFNEAWGLITRKDGKESYEPETQRRVAASVKLAKSLDSTRLVEDNSPCCGRGHVETDINSWHSYLPGWEWEHHLDVISDSTKPGSPWNFEKGYVQGRQPNINSEFGNVWGYAGSTGDVDWSWDYHLAVNAFRRHPRIAGWLYTEHHDVINEWNGYWRFDRSEKETGLGELVPGMTLRDLHAPFYLAVDTAMSRTVEARSRVTVPLWASFLTGSAAHGDSLVLRTQLYGWNALGERRVYDSSLVRIPYRPWMSEALAPLTVTMPDGPAVVVLAVRLEDRAGTVLQRNFATYVVSGDVPATVTLADGRSARVVRVAADAYRDARWSLKTWKVMGGKKVDGAGSGYFEYAFPWPRGVAAADISEATFLVEASAKQLYGKDRDSTAAGGGDYMRGKGLHDPSANPNAYPMTDATKFPSAVTVRVNGEVAGLRELADDPADSRGILSWHAQARDHHLHEAGSYGELLRVAIPRAALERAASSGTLVIRLEVSDALPGGLAIYGAQFGRYPLDPTVMLVTK